MSGVLVCLSWVLVAPWRTIGSSVTSNKRKCSHRHTQNATKMSSKASYSKQIYSQEGFGFSHKIFGGLCIEWLSFGWAAPKNVQNISHILVYHCLNKPWQLCLRPRSFPINPLLPTHNPRDKSYVGSSKGKGIIYHFRYWLLYTTLPFLSHTRREFPI